MNAQLQFKSNQIIKIYDQTLQSSKQPSGFFLQEKVIDQNSKILHHLLFQRQPTSIIDYKVDLCSYLLHNPIIKWFKEEELYICKKHLTYEPDL